MNLGDKKHVVSVRLNDEMYQWCRAQVKDAQLKSVGDFIRVLIRIGLSMDARQHQIVEAFQDCANIVQEEQGKRPGKKHGKKHGKK